MHFDHISPFFWSADRSAHHTPVAREMRSIRSCSVLITIQVALLVLTCAGSIDAVQVHNFVVTIALDS